MQTIKDQPVRRKVFPSILKIIGIACLVIVLLGAGGAWYGWTRVQAMLEPVSDSDHQVLINVPKGATSSAIGKILEEAELIHNATAFRYWLRYYELDGKIQAGDYILSPSMNMEAIVDKLVKGQVHRETIKFTIPEGLYIPDLASRLERLGLVDKDLFLELINDVDRWDYWFLKDIPDNVDQPLEGYLFPDTYELFANEANKEERIISLMLNRFNQVFTQEWRDRADEVSMSVHEVVTLASIVQREVLVDHERSLVAGVFFNRLKMREPLGSCATINYVLGDFSIRYLTTAQTRTPSPYNTYINQGLPPGPIGGPGRASLRAVLWPEETKYLFFVAKDDGSGEHYFAETNAQHEAYARKAKANRENRP